MNKMTKKITRAFIIIVLLAAALITGYFFLNEHMNNTTGGDKLPRTEMGKLLAKDLDNRYPQLPTEVVKLYWRLTACIYDTDINDKNFDKLLKQLRKLYDEELLAHSDNSFENMRKHLKRDSKKRSAEKQTISSYVVQKDDTVYKKEIDGRECATVISSTLVKAKSKTTKTYENFMCRRDKEGKWKILGWQQTTADVADEVGVE